jgi:hypothetical protein
VGIVFIMDRLRRGDLDAIKTGTHAGHRRPAAGTSQSARRFFKPHFRWRGELASNRPQPTTTQIATKLSEIKKRSQITLDH